MTTFAPDTTFGKYRIIRLLGQGGMADVYEAEDTAIGRVVALKILPLAFARDQERAGRFAKEIQASAALDHPNIVSVFEVGEIDGLHYYTMSVLPGGDLKARLKTGALSQKEALRITRELAGALHYAHEKGFVHRDVKPENILFRQDGSAVLTDFGIARATGSQTRMTATGLSIGTPHYMSPEQARGKEVDGRSDLYALGVVFHEMLTGKVPFDAQDSLAVAYQHVNDTVPNLPEGLAGFQPVIDRLLAKEPQDRYADGRELVGDLERIEAGEMPAPEPEGAQLARERERARLALRDRIRAWLSPKRAAWIWGAGGAALASVIALYVLVYPGLREIEPGPLAGTGSVIEQPPRQREEPNRGSGSAGPTKSESEIAWEQTREVDTEEAYAAFLRRYGRTSPRADEARARRDALEEERVRAIELELVRLGRDVEVDGNLYNDADDQIRKLENLLGRQVRGEGDVETLAMLQSLQEWPDVDTVPDDVAAWKVGDVVERSVLTRPVLLPELEDLGPMPLMELFQEQVSAGRGGQAILAVVHGLGGDSSDWTRLNPAMVTIATRAERGFKVIYRRRFGRLPNRVLFEGTLSDVELIPPVLRISWLESSATRNYVFEDWIGLAGNGSIVDVTTEIPPHLSTDGIFGSDETSRGSGGLIHEDGEFYRVSSVYKVSDASCCPSGGRFKMYFDLEQDEDEVRFVATRWEHELENGTVRTSQARASPAPVGGGSNPVAHYTFDRTITDEVRDSNAVLVGNASYTMSNPTGTHAFLFDGRTHLNIGRVYDLAENDISVTFWVRFDSGPPDNQIFTNDASFGDTYLSATYANNNTSKLRIAVKNGRNAANVYTRGSLRLQVWYHVALIRAGNSASIYINGALKGAGSLPAGSLGNSREWLLGKGLHDANFVGAIDDFRVYDRALSPSEVADFAAAAAASQ